MDLTVLRSRRAFEAFLVVLAVVAIVAGTATVLLGAESLVGGDSVSATVDSELRFYSVWYVGTGFLLLWCARNIDRAGPFIRGIAVLLLVAGLARGLSWVTVGKPHAVAQVLMVIELVLPSLIVLWHAALARHESGRVARDAG